ncbi:MAG: AAA family ATPase [Thermodesulfobacteriota bacterium]|nr:AAA family ATPase [Thermodesulfobacteriota bacterium]
MINESLTCPGCGSHVDRTDRFCRQCGLCLEKTPEIKQQRYVTILFSDLSGYTSMSEDLDTEELSEIMGRIFNHASKTISDLSGKVEKFIGDAIVAIFGMETTREDDVIRAIRAAIEIHSFVKDMDVTRITDRPLRMHTGINAGEILVTPGKEGALGRPINLASRISVLAPAGDILIGDTIYPEANRFFRLEPFSNTHLKGIHRIVTTYRVVAPRQLPLPVHGENSFVSPLIGRKEQLSTLKRHLNDLYHKKGSTMHVSGQAGVGKSRLIEEFRSIVPRDINWIDAVCLDYAGNIPYFPIKGIVGSIIEKTTLPTIKEKFSSRLDNFIRGVADKTGLGPNEWKMQVFGTVAELIRQASGILPMVICIENLHWADPSSLDLIRYLDSSLDCPCLFVLSSREALNMPGEKIRLDDLSREQSLCMVKNMMNIKGLSEKEMNHLFCLSAGNPFFLEEIVNFGITSKTGLSSLHGFPNTIKGMVSAGLDHLDQDSKEVLQRACVIGSSFSPGLIDALCPDMELNSALFDLIDAGYLAMKKDDRICFRHDLVREVTYDGMLKGVRQGLHLKIGLEMETMYTDNIQPWAEVLAHHILQHDGRQTMQGFRLLGGGSQPLYHGPEMYR